MKKQVSSVPRASANPECGALAVTKVRRFFEPETSAVPWVGKIVECREDGGWFEERGHFVTVARADDRPHVGEWGWFYTETGMLLHTSEVYPPNAGDVPRAGNGVAPKE